MSEWNKIETLEANHGDKVLGVVEFCGAMCIHPIYYSAFDRNWRFKIDGRIVDRATHWMPLPELPE